MPTSATKQVTELGPQFATIRIRDGEPSPKGPVEAWAKFGAAKFFNEDAADYAIKLAAEGAKENPVVLMLPSMGSVAFTSLIATNFEYAIYSAADRIEKSAAGRGGGPIKFELVEVRVAPVTIKGANH